MGTSAGGGTTTSPILLGIISERVLEKPKLDLCWTLHP